MRFSIFSSPLPIRARLTLWYVGVAGLALLASSGALYVVLTRGFVGLVDSSLGFYARSLARNALAESPSDGQPSPDDPNFMARPSGGAPLFSPQVVQVLDASGAVTQQVVESPVGGEFPSPLGNRQRAAQEQGPFFETVFLADGRRFRLATVAVRASTGETELFITVGQDLADLKRLQNLLLTGFGAAIPSVLLLLGFGGRLLVGQALKPVDALTRAARRIGEGNLKERVPVVPSGDELGRLAETFNAMIAELEAAFERQRQFTADASHELRTPLAIMRGEIEIVLRKERPPDEYRRTLESLLEETLRLSKLAEDLLTLARSDGGRMALESTEVDAVGLCLALRDALLPLAESRGLTLDLRIGESPMIVRGDPARLRRLVLNLLDNALKYTPKGGTVTLSAERMPDDAPPPRIRITVADDGPGIPLEDRPRVFDRFYRRLHSGSDETGGFGLGLPIARRLAELHGGSLTLDDSAARGAAFVVVLPSVAAAIDATSSPSPE